MTKLGVRRLKTWRKIFGVSALPQRGVPIAIRLALTRPIALAWSLSWRSDRGRLMHELGISAHQNGQGEKCQAERHQVGSGRERRRSPDQEAQQSGNQKHEVESHQRTRPNSIRLSTPQRNGTLEPNCRPASWPATGITPLFGDRIPSVQRKRFAKCHFLAFAASPLACEGVSKAIPCEISNTLALIF